MGVLASAGGGKRVTLGERCLVGRSPMCQLQLDANAVSAEHATLFWSDGKWWLRDLGSTNGTFLGDERLEPGKKRSLTTRVEIRFGGTDEPLRWELVERSPPGVRARHVGDDAVLSGTGDLLCLPNEDEPVVSVFADTSHEWVADFDGTPRRVADHEVIRVNGEAWLLELPPPVACRRIETTHRATGIARALEACALSFRVSSDEEFVELAVLLDGEWMALPPRSHHYTLLTLARHRLADANGELPESEQGWVYADDFARELGSTRQKVNLDVCRARQQLACVGVEGAGRVVERRPTTQQLRIGVARLAVEGL